jgi:Replication initiation factor
METAGLHQLRFYPRIVPETVTTKYLDETTKHLFGLPLSSFTKLPSHTHNKRKYRNAYSYENKIILLEGDFTKRYTLTIEINGGAFDHACINIAKISSIIEQDYIVLALHAKIDTDITKFKQLFQCYQLDSVSSSKSKRSDRQSTTRTITFGKAPAEYSIYEAGLFHPELGNKNLARHEVRFTGDNARQFFQQWRKNSENLATLIKGYIAGHFHVVFKDHTSTDSNISRRPPLPVWEKWLGTAAPRHFDRVEPTPPRIENQIKSYTTKLLQIKITLGEHVYSDILGRVEDLYQNQNDPEPHEVQMELPL